MLLYGPMLFIIVSHMAHASEVATATRTDASPSLLWELAVDILALIELGIRRAGSDGGRGPNPKMRNYGKIDEIHHRARCICQD
jgi:hypothetical protein